MEEPTSNPYEEQRPSPAQLRRIRRQAQSDPEPLRRLVAIKQGQAYWDQLLEEAVYLARRSKPPRTWQEIGDAYGITKQGARKRFFDLDPNGGD